MQQHTLYFNNNGNQCARKENKLVRKPKMWPSSTITSRLRECNCYKNRRKAPANQKEPNTPQSEEAPSQPEAENKKPKGIDKPKSKPPKPVAARNLAFGSSKNIQVTQLRRLSSSSGSFFSNKPNGGKKRRPIGPVTQDNVTLRRGQQQSAPPSDELAPSRSSSTTALNEQAIGAASAKNHRSNGGGARPKKAESKEKLAPPPPPPLSSNNKRAAIQTKNNNSANNNEQQHQIDVKQLQTRLAEMADEKATLEAKLGEQGAQMRELYGDLGRFRRNEEETRERLDRLLEENDSLRNRLRDVSHSPLSDNEKQQLLFESQRLHSSAPASIATNVLDDGGNGDVTACPTPEWDKHSSGNVSEVSVACLQDKINQMQETHYSTNEELQATLQELTDLQRQLTELQQDNLRLGDEKTLMFESLCRQTERLNESRNEVETLKQQLFKDESNDFDPSQVEREAKLVDLVKIIQDEKSTLHSKNAELVNDLDELRRIQQQQQDENVILSERIKSLESRLDAKNAEYKQTEIELQTIKEHCNNREIEINRLKDLLENARTKIAELEQDRALSDKSELDEMLDNARKEKDQLEAEVTHLREQLALSRNDVVKYREQVSILQEECKVIRNNAKTTQSDMEYKVEKLLMEKIGLGEQLQQFQEHVSEIQMERHVQNDEKRQLSTVLSETQRNLNESERRVEQLEEELIELKHYQKEQEEEWTKFQSDLLTSVRVANDFKTEAQQHQEKLVMENKAGRERIRQLELQIEKMKVSTEPNPTPPIRPTSFQLDDITVRRQKVSLSRQSSRQSVKSLIECIENAGKPPSSTTPTLCMKTSSRCSSNSSLNSINSELKTPSSPMNCIDLKGQTGDCWMDMVKTPLKEQQPNIKMNSGSNGTWGKIGDAKNCDFGSGKNNAENYSILSKGLDYSRRNSYSDLSERKDPLNGLVKNGGSKRNALLKWCQNKTVGYRNIDITNFSSSWNDGLALCALLHTYLPDLIPYDNLNAIEKRRNFSLAFSAAESVGIPTTLIINEMIQLERPDWQQVMGYVTAIYKHFET